MGYAFALIAILGGVALIVGGVQRWPWLIPTKRNMFFHPLTFTSLFVSQQRLWIASIVYGVAYIAIGILIILKLTHRPI